MTRELRIWAYCTAPAQRSVAEATGVEPLVSPPLTINEFDPLWLEGHDLLYFRLHGMSQATIWYGEGEGGALCPAFHVGLLEGVDLDGATVIVANCYGAESAMVQALYRAGAGAVVAGSGRNFAAGSRVVGADKLAREAIQGLRRGWPVLRALYIARLKLLSTAWRAADRDALEFRVIERSVT